MEAILDDEFCNINAFLGAGHVCAIMGYEAYYPLVEKYKIPIVITGFEPLDLVEGIYRLLLSDYSSPVNIGNPNEISLKDFAEEVLKLTGSSVKIVYKDLPVDDPKQRQPDITKAKKLLGWDEILEGGISPNAMVMSWRGTKGGIEAAKQNHDVVMSPNSYFYIDYYQSEAKTEPIAIGGFLPLSKCYSFEPDLPELTAEEAKHVVGIQANLWTEYISNLPYAEYMTYPRALALSEVSWSPKGSKNYEDFKKRLKGHMPSMDALKINYSKAFLSQP